MRRIRTLDVGNSMYHLGINYANPFVLTGGDPDRIRTVAQDHLDSGYKVFEHRGLVTVHGTYKGILPVTAFSTGMGPPSVAITLPEIIESCDYNRMVIIRIGTAGALNKNLKIGDFVATTEVEIAESTSEKIMGPGYRAITDEILRRSLIENANRSKFAFQTVYEAMTRTTDDFYWDAEQSKLRGSRDDVIAVSMECSPICAVRDWYNRHDPNGREILASELLSISDNVVLEQPHIDMQEFQSREMQIREAHILAGLETLLAFKDYVR
ncbi:MAG: hypothetical protein NDI94_04645 [Candidatus Woesearchaeota archaeon]|nr:hypothetical protein [Candidatus Woesearchaeota archaeon]